MSQVKQAWSTPAPKVYHQDLYSVLNPTTCFGRIAGIFPLTLEGVVNKRKYSSSYVSLIYSLTVLVLTTIGLFVCTDHTEERWTKHSDHEVLDISIRIEIILEFSSTVLMIGAAILHRDKFANAIHILSLQDISLRKFGIRLDYATELKRKYIQLGIIILIVVIHSTYDFVYQLKFNLGYPLNWISWMTPNMIRIISACLFVDVVIILKQRFAALNEYLKKMIEDMEHSSVMTPSTQQGTCQRIRLIAIIHGALCEAALSVNQIFGYSIIVGVMYALVILTTSAYHILQEIKDPNRSYSQMLGSLNWGVVSCINIIYIVTACHFAQTQAGLTGKLIHKFPMDGYDTPLINVIQSFSLQLQHQKIEFSAAGLFPLDATLIQSIAGAVTTYLVILIQIDASTSQIPASYEQNISSI